MSIDMAGGDDETELETIAKVYGVKRAAEVFHKHGKDAYLTLSQEQLAGIITGAYTEGVNDA